MTPAVSRLSLALDEEYLRMQNEWFFKWHFIGKDGPVEIESFNGKPIRYGGIRFSGSAHQVYWDTIQRYLRKKVSAILNSIEEDIANYPLDTKLVAIKEAAHIINQYVVKIRRAATEKDRILRGDGIRFPEPRDQGVWLGCHPEDVESQISALREIYIKQDKGASDMPFRDVMTDQVTFAKKHGEVIKSNIRAQVQPERIIVDDVSLPIEVGDKFLRKLPNGLTETYIVLDPGFRAGLRGAIPDHYQAKVRRSDAPSTAPTSITAHFSGPNSRFNVNSIDGSVNFAGDISAAQLSDFLVQVRASMGALPADQQKGIGEPLAALEGEAASAQPSQTKIHAALASLKTVVEGAAGNLIATGIAGLAGKLLGG